MKEHASNNSSSEQFLNATGSKTKSNAIEVPAISLPKGGGAIRGIDEKFSVNAVNGTSSFSIPLPFSPGRGNVPSLNLSYSSGTGNGIFGLGWNLNLGTIKRKTDKGLPQYLDEIDSDEFLFASAEELVPEFKKGNDGNFVVDINGNYIINENDSLDNLFKIRFYKPRIEGLFARIERWTEKATRQIKWRIITKDNQTTLFGWSVDSVISDPNDPKNIFEWLPEFSFDDKGNSIQYIYKKEDQKGFNQSLLHNKNRFKTGNITYTNLYLEKVLYGNKIPYKHFRDTFLDETAYMFQTVFDYGEYDTNTHTKVQNWDFRIDPFSDYKAGFEIRTTRLCKRVLLFHFFDELPNGSALIKSINCEYNTSVEQGFTLLNSVTSMGYIKMPNGTYTNKALPPLKFAYQQHDWNKEVKYVNNMDQTPYQFADLFNEGLPGILMEQANGWYYKHNIGGGKFAKEKSISPKPSFVGLGKHLQFADLEADGSKQLVSLTSEPRGYFELNDDELWQTFCSFNTLPNIDFNDPNLRMLDLNGDGKPEILITEEEAFTWYASDGKNGFTAGQKKSKSFNEEDGPHMVFADASQSIFLADMSGDGMIDIVRIKNAEVCYWPNLGYGNFGKKVSFDNAPLFDHPESFNPSFLRLADIDGTGTTDLIYLGKNNFTCWLNLSGNTFTSLPFQIVAFPEIHHHTDVTITDLLGNGVACIVWSSSIPKDAHASLKYIDLMNSKKPHLLISYQNNLGKEVLLEYTPSTAFYMEDKLAGKPWVTKLHFPVHCISKTTIEDKISGYSFVSTYKYHHGYYDHDEREFRGFGMVEQTDSETFDHWKKGNASNIVAEPLHQEPVVTKTWFHTGTSHLFEADYWYQEMQRQELEVTHQETLNTKPIISDKLKPNELCEALRACKGMPLRSEIFAKDGVKQRELTPFSVAAHNCLIKLIQPKGRNKHAVFLVKEREKITYGYERNPEDPRIAHSMNIDFDEYGNVLQSASVVYPRLTSDQSLPAETRQKQNETITLFTQNQFTNDIILDEIYRLRLPSEVKTFELKGAVKSSIFYSPDDFKDINPSQSRLIEHVRSVYYDNNLKEALPLHQLESLAIPFENYQLAFTPELVNDIFGSKVNTSLLTEGKYINSEGDNNWWIRSGTAQFITGAETTLTAKNRFYLPISYTDPYGAITTVKYDNNYFLFVEETVNALGNRSTVANFNFRTLAATRMKDVNGNFSETILDELGFVKAVAILGKGNEADELTGITEITDANELTSIDSFFQQTDTAQLTALAKSLLNHATSRFVYDLNAYIKLGKPAVVSVINREQHFQQNVDSPVQIGFEYSNGLGQVVMKKVQAEPGMAKQVIVQVDDSFAVSEIDTSLSNPKQLRWVGNGRSILNNKGNAVKQYEPYFSVTHQYEELKELVETGVTPIMYYDAIGRLIKTELPDGTFSKVTFNSWQQTNYDTNDTVLDSSWYKNRTNNLIDAELIAAGKNPLSEKQAADKAAKHANTPVILHFDTLGRPILSINVMPQPTEAVHTKIKLDVEGNLRSVTDARGNVVSQYLYDMLGNMVYLNSMDAGQRWLLADIFGKPIRTWDERNHEFQYFYDIIQRPTHSKVIGGDGVEMLDHVYDRIIYGESLLMPDRSNETDLQLRNIFTQPILHYDTGGLIEAAAYDFKGQPVTITYKLFSKYKEVANWVNENLVNDLEPEIIFTFITKNDALGRIIQQIAPDGSIITPTYNEAGKLTTQRVLHPGNTVSSLYINNISYNEKGQREKIVYGNNVSTKFHYDKETLRLKRLTSKRQNGDPLQDLNYTYDPVGNITHIEDKNIPTVFFNNQKVTGIANYTYDALYRLTEATGRENNAALGFTWNDASFIQQFSPGDPMVMRNYTQTYQYDTVGNMIQMRHQAPGNNWTRNYHYQANNNRLISTQLGSETSLYPHHAQHGYITQMPHLEEMGWNFKEEMIRSIKQNVTLENGTAETTYYQYNGKGQRIRKITENHVAAGITPTKKEERIYISSYELYKKHSGNSAGLERVTLGLIDEGNCFARIETRNNIDDGSEKTLVRYQLPNHLGSSALELADNAEVVSYEEYHPFGTTAFQANNKSIKAVAKRYRYTGMERDEETGLEYHSARYYVTWLGRWTAADPIGIGDGLNIYQYGKNNPLKFNDTRGTDVGPKSDERTKSDEEINRMIQRTKQQEAQAPQAEPPPLPEPSFWEEANSAIQDVNTFLLYANPATGGPLMISATMKGIATDLGASPADLAALDFAMMMAGNEAALMESLAVQMPRQVAAARPMPTVPKLPPPTIPSPNATLALPNLINEPNAVQTVATMYRGHRRVQVNVGDAYGYKTVTDGHVVADLALKLEARGQNVVIGTGGHGQYGTGKNFINTPAFVEDAFLLEDLDLGWDSNITILDLTSKYDYQQFKLLEAKARSGQGNTATIRAWCFGSNCKLQ